MRRPRTRDSLYASGSCGRSDLPFPRGIEREHAAVAREVRDLHLPAARVDDRPRRDEHHRRLALAVDLVEDADAVALDVALLVGVAGARLLARRARRSGSTSHPSIQSRSSAWPVVDSPRALDDDPDVERHDERDESLERHGDASSRCGSRSSVSTARHSAFTRASRSRRSGVVPGERLQLEPDLLVGRVLATR